MCGLYVVLYSGCNFVISIVVQHNDLTLILFQNALDQDLRKSTATIITALSFSVLRKREKLGQKPARQVAGSPSTWWICA